VRGLIALAICGCGRFDFDVRIDGSIDGHVRLDADAVIDGQTVQPCDWFRSGGPVLGAELQQTNLVLGMYETDPALDRGDPLTMYFSSDRDGTSDIYRATRVSVDALFEAPQKVVDISTTMFNEQALHLEYDGHGYYTTTQSGTSDIYEIQRDMTGTLAIVRPLSELDLGSEQDVFVTPDGLELWFTRTNASQDIHIVTRANTASTWGNERVFEYNTTNFNEGSPSMTADGRVLVWTGTVGGADADVYYALRASSTDPWGPRQVLLGTPAFDLEPSVSADGCELTFVRGLPTWRVFSVKVQ
jgi:hypothetical protein